MDKIRLKEATERLLAEVDIAKASGYKIEAILTPEVRTLLPGIMNLELEEPVTLQYAAGAAWNFSETSLGECKNLESAWAEFRIELEGRRKFIEALKTKMG
ncbi:MAG: hypothetical protein V4634_23370 [Pseudomonadota bacterium]